MIAIALGLFAVVMLGLHWATTALALRHIAGAKHSTTPMPRITLLRPACGVDPADEATLGSSFHLSPAPAEVIFCVARETDPVVPLLRRLIESHPRQSARLLIGDDRISGNPKLNNLVKGWKAVQTDWVAMTDSNVLLPRDYLATLAGAWDEKCGLVTSPACGIEPDGLWGRVECAFLNGNQARLQLASSQLGHGFAQGKTLYWNRPMLEKAGGLAALGGDLAEDVAATKVVHGQGLQVRLAPRPFPQPIGHRNARAVWDRQLRWSRVRRQGFPGLFLLEPLNGPVVPVLALAAASLMGAMSPLATVLFLLGWYGAEAALARRAGWPMGAADLLASGLRDAMMPALWLATFARQGFEWRGTSMAPGIVENAAVKE